MATTKPAASPIAAGKMISRSNHWATTPSIAPSSAPAPSATTSNLKAAPSSIFPEATYGRRTMGRL
jgi:hypothetical protein